MRNSPIWERFDEKNLPELDLACVENYWLEGKNWYYVNAEKFWITREELVSCLIYDDKAYLNRKVCEKLQELSRELTTKYWLKIIIKDAYRSELLYLLIMKKREEKEGREFVQKSFNTKWDFPHASWDSVDISFVNIQTREPLVCTKPIEDLNERRQSWAVDYYEHSTELMGKEIHKNRIFIRKMMNIYWFEWINHEYWHFNYKN